MQSYDLIIVGGGLVGAGLAAAMRDTPLRIALIDAREPSNVDPRLFGLTASSVQFLKNIHVWPTLLPHASPINQVHVSNKGRFGAVRLHHEDVSLPYLGYTIPAFEIETALNHKLNENSSVTCYRPAKLIGLSQTSERAILTIEMADGEKQLSGALVIGADGTHSTVRTLSGIKAEVTDYHQSAIVTRTTLQRSHHHIAYERFNASGAIAMLPLQNNECATIWTTTSEDAAALLTLSQEDFLNTLRESFGYRLGKMLAIGKRHQFPLQSVKAETNVLGRILLVGNAAHTLHPIAAQGFNLALYEVAALAESVTSQLKDNQSFTTEMLAEVSRKSDVQQSISMGVSNQLVNLFSKKSAMISCLLQLGMVGLEVATPVKRYFLKKILGKHANTPDLLLNNSEL